MSLPSLHLSSLISLARTMVGKSTTSHYRPVSLGVIVNMDLRRFAAKEVVKLMAHEKSVQS